MWGTVAASAGVVATALFVLSSLPMLAKAARSRDLSSYSGANLLIANVGNVAQALYLTTLPAGPLWVLHGFNTAVSGLMLGWWLRRRPRPGAAAGRSGISRGRAGGRPAPRSPRSGR